MDYLTEARRLYEEAIAPYKGVPVGATGAEVAALEQEVGFALPEAYRQYLLWMGRDYRGIFTGSDWFLQNGYNDTTLLNDLHGLDFNQFMLPEHFFVFFCHQGYVAAWFLLPKTDDDPPVYFFSEGGKMDAPIMRGTFTDFLQADIERFAALKARMKGING